VLCIGQSSSDADVAVDAVNVFGAGICTSQGSLTTYYGTAPAAQVPWCLRDAGVGLRLWWDAADDQHETMRDR
jgi:hypothetical protein